MLRTNLVTALVACGALVTQPAFANSCQKWAVTAADGYANVRSTAQVKEENIVGTLATGTGIEPVSHHQRWLQIRSPLTGWIAGSQIAQISCDDAVKLLFDKGLPTITRLGKQAAQKNQQAAETVIKMAPSVDGVTAEAYAVAVATLAAQNPTFMVSILQQQSSTIRRAFLNSLDFGLGESPERQNFEKFLTQLPPDHLIVRDWQCRDKAFP